MANAKKCDRCGKFFEPYVTDLSGYTVNGISAIRRFNSATSYDTRITFDLCPECMDGFVKWLNEPEDIRSDEF